MDITPRDLVRTHPAHLAGIFHEADSKRRQGHDGGSQLAQHPPRRVPLPRLGRDVPSHGPDRGPQARGAVRRRGRQRPALPQLLRDAPSHADQLQRGPGQAGRQAGSWCRRGRARPTVGADLNQARAQQQQQGTAKVHRRGVLVGLGGPRAHAPAGLAARRRHVPVVGRHGRHRGRFGVAGGRRRGVVGLEQRAQLAPDVVHQREGQAAAARHGRPPLNPHRP